MCKCFLVSSDGRVWVEQIRGTHTEEVGVTKLCRFSDENISTLPCLYNLQHEVAPSLVLKASKISNIWPNTDQIMSESFYFNPVGIIGVTNVIKVNWMRMHFLFSSLKRAFCLRLHYFVGHIIQTCNVTFLYYNSYNIFSFYCHLKTLFYFFLEILNLSEFVTSVWTKNM